jgi:hypothetical protein
VTPNERQHNAREVLRNQVFNEAFEDLEKDLLASWKATHPDDWKGREKMHAQFTALQDVRQKLETFIHTAALETTAKVKHGRTERYSPGND